MELIDKDALIHELKDELCFYPALVRKAIERQPVIESKEEKHGRWICDAEVHICSKCSCAFNLLPIFAHYCPNCGAKMDLEG